MSACRGLLVCLLVCAVGASSAVVLPRRSAVWPFKGAVQYKHITIDQAARALHEDIDCMVLVVGTDRPRRWAVSWCHVSPLSRETRARVKHCRGLGEQP